MIAAVDALISQANPERGMAQRSVMLDALAPALAKAQGAIEAAAKDANNPHFGSRYADLASVWSACRAQLSDNGLSVVQLPCGEGERVGLTTMLIHASGQYVSSTIFATAERKGPQAVGSVLTYLRRYSLAAMVGVAPDDDDGNAAEPAPGPANDNGRRIAARPALARPQAEPPPAKDGQPVPSSSGPSLASLRRYHALRDELKVSEDEGRERVSKLVGRTVESINDLSQAEMSRVLDRMESAVGPAA